MTPSLEFAMNNGLSARQAVMIELVVAGDEAALRTMLEPILVRSDDEWIMWDGGACPVDPKTIVEIKVRDGFQLEPRHARDCRWFWLPNHIDASRDIVAYRVLS